MDLRTILRPQADTGPESRTSAIEEKCGWADVEEVLGEFRRSVRVAAERPGSFWDSQRAAVNAKLRQSRPAPWRRPALVWAPAAAILILCLFLFVKDGNAPTPDFAGGADQDLLMGVERATDRVYPSAFDPAALITQEMEQTVKTTGP
jgi:hypothetical protein